MPSAFGELVKAGPPRQPGERSGDYGVFGDELAIIAEYAQYMP